MNQHHDLHQATNSATPGSLTQAETLPRTYFVFDSQTTGLEPDDVILQFAHLQVVDGKIVEVGRRFLNWLNGAYPYSRDWLLSRLEQSRRFHGIRPEDLQQGEDPRQLIAEYRLRLNQVPFDRSVIVGHSIYSFDLPVLQRHLMRWVGGPGLSPNLPVFDIGITERMSQAHVRVFPDESLLELHHRVENMRIPGGRWSLKYCLEKNEARVEVSNDHPLFNLYAAQAVYESYQRLLVANAGKQIAHHVTM